MSLTVEQRKEIVLVVNTLWAKACEMFDLGDAKIHQIDLGLRGKCAGQAWVKYNMFDRSVAETKLRLNASAFVDNWDEMMKDTIPHELAHLVCYYRPELGSNHDRGWKRVCQMLGGSGDRTHSMALKPAKGGAYKYVATCGTEMYLSKVIHNRVQAGQTRILRATKGKINASCYVRPGAEKPAVEANTASKTPAKKKFRPGKSNAELVRTIIRNNPSMSTEGLIKLVIQAGIITNRSMAKRYVVENKERV